MTVAPPPTPPLQPTNPDPANNAQDAMETELAATAAGQALAGDAGEAMALDDGAAALSGGCVSGVPAADVRAFLQLQKIEGTLLAKAAEAEALLATTSVSANLKECTELLLFIKEVLNVKNLVSAQR